MRAVVEPGCPGGQAFAPRSDGLVVYSCVTKGYDHGLPPAEPRDGISYVCFSDDPALSAPGWAVRPLQSPPQVRQPRLISRYHKVFAHDLFPESRWSVWIDGNIESGLGVEAAVAALEESGLAIAAFSHPAGRDLGEEFYACWHYERFLPRDKWRVLAQIRHFERERFPLHTPLTENRVLVRDHHHPALPETMALLWSMLTRYTSRDQLSLQYCLWKSSEAALLLETVDGISQDLLTIRLHAPRRPTLYSRIAHRFKWLRPFSPLRALLSRQVAIARKACIDRASTRGNGAQSVARPARSVRRPQPSL
jgi:hypothetical protein